MNASIFNILKSDDFWSIITRYMGDHRNTTSFHNYKKISSAIKYGYLELIKKKEELHDTIKYDHFSEAIAGDNLKLVKWLVKHIITKIHHIEWHSVKNLEIAEFLRGQFDVYKILEMAKVTICCPVDVVEFLHKKGHHRTSVSALINAFNKYVRDNKYVLPLDKLQFLQKKYRQAITYDVLSTLEVRDDNEEYIKKHDLMRCALHNTEDPYRFVTNDNMYGFNLTFLKLYDQMEGLIRHLRRKSNLPKLLRFFENLIKRGRIDVIDYLSTTTPISLNFFKQKYCYEMREIFVNSIHKIDCDTLSHFLQYPEFKDLSDTIPTISVCKINSKKSTPEEIIRKIRLLEEVGIEIFVPLISFRDKDSGMLHIELLKRLKLKMRRYLLGIYRQKFGLLVVRYMHNYMEWSRMLNIYNLVPHEEPVCDFFTLVALFFEERNPNIYKSIRWYYYNRLRTYVCGVFKDRSLDAHFAACYLDTKSDRLDDATIISYHKVILQILMKFAEITNSEQYLKQFTHILLSCIVKQSLVELVEYYIQYSPYVNIHDFIHIATTNLKTSIIMRLVELRPDLRSSSALLLRMIMIHGTEFQQTKSRKLFALLASKYIDEDCFQINLKIE